MSHDRCYEHKCRACSKCAETPIGVDSADPRVIPAEVIADWKYDHHRHSHGMTRVEQIDALIEHGEALSEQVDHQRAKFCWHDPEGQYAAMQARADAAAKEVERLHVVIDQEARARQHAESEVARLQSYIAAGVGGAS